MGKDIDALATRLRRVRALDTENGQYERVKQVLWRTWDTQRRPPYVQVRVPFIQAHTENELLRRPAATRLLNPRGIAQRFYLLGLFEAQCRLTSGALFTKALPIDGEGDRDGWTDLIAVDTLYSSRSNSYGRRDVKQHRTPNTAKIRQIHSALTPLEKQGLAEVPRKNAHGHRDFERFTLMDEMGRGSHPTPRQYTTPDPRQKRFVGMPVNFFLEGWIHVLHPSEIATWLTLRFLRWQVPGEHEESRVFLYADTREKGFFLKRDAYEDGCAMLRDLGLIRQVQKAPDMEDTLYHPLPGWDRTWTASSVWPPPPSVDRRASRDRRLENGHHCD
ncbi:hypothetical protein [Nocardiopsis sp. B62]|uniref:hypothetical protein n=1 Tax=Nocardiopsis sp. B62 TaxID=2824874 RepID=UPI001B3832AD|nr:hypothetical protein [Nocardiopsis sp. B62]MBQ1080976.1 hypothetical protein [Nocardiopsis sp. B62]